jgi:aspartyl-tRNA synthetase
MVIAGLLKTHSCGELNRSHVGQTVTLCGWVNKSRDLGGLHFKDVRDKYGLTQLNFSQYQGSTNVALESTILAKGVVQERPKEAFNKEMETGEVEILVNHFQILSESDKDKLPFLPTGKIEAGEDLRLKYRYLDLRSPRLQNILKLRSNTAQVVRKILHQLNFVEVETPILYKSTPEGARDYVVPSRVHPGHVYALPQSPQTLKQLLMIGGTDKYFQIVKCFRDEDLRADRQPEFSQIDIEVSFATQTYIKNLVTEMIKQIFKLPENYQLESMTYQQAVEEYGSDKPDFRFDLKHMNVGSCFKGSGFQLFEQIVAENGLVKAIFVPQSLGSLARKDIDLLVDVVKPFGGKGVAFLKCDHEGRTGSLAKFVTDEIYKKLKSKNPQNDGDENGLWLFCADKNPDLAHSMADAVRRHLGHKLKLIKDEINFKWIIDFPLLEYVPDEKRFVARHHPFTSPHPQDMDKFLSGSHQDLIDCRADAYDLVCNGYELAGGSVRIFQNHVQKKMFEVLGMSEEETKKQFGFFLEALQYGVPPHAGCAFGFDRMIMMLAKTDNIRDVIAFPKTATASDLMSSCPSTPSKAQTDELHFTWLK